METINYKGYFIKIDNDNDGFADNPGDWGNTDSFLVYDHRDFFVEQKGFDPEDIFEVMQTGKKLFDGYFYFPVYAYIHSGVSLQLKRWFNGVPQGHNQFDVSFKGFALVKKEKGSYTMEKAYKIAEGIVETWNDYLSGNVWNFRTEDKNGNFIDSCCGFYGDPEKSGLMDEAKSSIDFEIKKRNKDKQNKVKTLLKNHVPVDKRKELILGMV
jgi:hypothetical protein